jgi:integrase
VSCGWIPTNPCVKIKLPLVAGGKRVIRVVLTPKQITDLATKLEEPYATLVLFLASTGLRIGEAIGVKWSDIDDNVLSVSRRIYIGECGLGEDPDFGATTTVGPEARKAIACTRRG